MRKLCLCTGDKETVYLKHVITSPNIEIGDGAIIGSRAAVTKDVPPYAIGGRVPVGNLDELERIV